MIPLTEAFSRTRQVPHTVMTPVVDEFSGLWVTDIIFRGEPTTPTSATIIFKPYDSETGIVNDSARRILTIDDVMNLAASNPAVAGAMNQLLTALATLAAEKQLNLPGGTAQARIEPTLPEPPTP